MCIQNFLNHNLNLFSEKNYKNKHKLCFHCIIHWSYITVEIYCNLIKKKSLDLDLKKFGIPYRAGINSVIYWTLTWQILELPIALGLILGYVGRWLEKCLEYLTEVRLIIWYIELGLKKCGVIYWTWINFITDWTWIYWIN